MPAWCRSGTRRRRWPWPPRCEALLRGPDLGAFLRVMYGNEPARWSDALHGADRWRFVVNALTRIRFCTDDGTLDFKTKEGAGAAPPGYRALVRRARAAAPPSSRWPSATGARWA